jgi:ribA/ribD-fused uncharacterized protein
MSGNTVGTFFKNRMKSTKLYAYSATGDLVTKDKSGSVIATVTIPTYRPPTEVEIATMESERLDRIAAAQEAFEGARRTMRSVIAEGVPGNIRRAMAEVTRADTRLQAARYAAKFIDVAVQEYEVRMIDFEDPRNTSKTVTPGLATGKREPIVHFLFRATPFSPQDLFCRVATPEEASTAAATTATTAATATKARTVLVISEPTGDTGFMSSWWPVRITYNDSEYPNAYQAILSELALVFNEADVAEEIRTAEAPDEVEFTVEDAEGATPEAWDRELERLLLDVNRAKFTQHPELADLLVNTGKSVLGYVPPEDATDAFQGIGLDADNPDAINYKRWTGQNKFGSTLGIIRKEFVEARKAAGAPRTALLRRKPVGARAATATVATAASAVADAASDIASTTAAAAAAGAAAVSRTAVAAADSLAGLFTPIATSE